MFGLVGAGRTRLARALFGLEPATEGTLEVLGERRRIDSPGDAIAAGSASSPRAARKASCRA